MAATTLSEHDCDTPVRGWWRAHAPWLMRLAFSATGAAHEAFVPHVLPAPQVVLESDDSHDDMPHTSAVAAASGVVVPPPMLYANAQDSDSDDFNSVPTDNTPMRNFAIDPQLRLQHATRPQLCTMVSEDQVRPSPGVETACRGGTELLCSLLAQAATVNLQGSMYANAVLTTVSSFESRFCALAANEVTRDALFQACVYKWLLAGTDVTQANARARDLNWEMAQAHVTRDSTACDFLRVLQNVDSSNVMKKLQATIDRWKKSTLLKRRR
jgi:hypothetical protein